MIRVGRTRNILRASSSLSEIWPRSAHHHHGQRRQAGRTNRPDKSPHSITCLTLRNSSQTRAASTRECSTPVPSAPPTSRRNPFSAHSPGRNSRCFQGLYRGGSTLCDAAQGRNPFSLGRYSPDLLTSGDLVGSLRRFISLRFFSALSSDFDTNSGWQENLKSNQHSINSSKRGGLRVVGVAGD